MIKKFFAIVILIFVSTILISCSGPKNIINEKSNGSAVGIISDNENNDSELYNYIKESIGFADSHLYGKYTSKNIPSGVTVENLNTTKINEEYNGGAVFYKNLSGKEDINNSVCFYLDDNETNDLFFGVKYYNADYSHTDSFASPHMKSRCYGYAKNDYIVLVEMAEKNEGTYDGYSHLACDNDISGTSYMEYEETLLVYKTEDKLEEQFSVTREITPFNSQETKMYTLSLGDDKFEYASGFSTFSHNNGVLFETEQEFCDKVNDLLSEIQIGAIKYNRTSWDNKWSSLKIDESYIPEDMVKVDFSVSKGEIDSDNILVSDIEINVNAAAEENTTISDLGEDSPVDYNKKEDSSNAEVMPDYIPESVSQNELQNLEYFNLDGYWVSSDMQYAFRIYTAKSDRGFNTYSFTRLNGNNKVKHGTVKQLSSYSLMLKPREDAEKSFELFSVNNQLKSDEITLNRVDDSIIYNLLGLWGNTDVSYEFYDDGKYKVHKGKDSYWGYFFIIDDNNIVLGKNSGELKIYDYQISGNDLIIDNNIYLCR